MRNAKRRGPCFPPETSCSFQLIFLDCNCSKWSEDFYTSHPIWCSRKTDAMEKEERESSLNEQGPLIPRPGWRSHLKRNSLEDPAPSIAQEAGSGDSAALGRWGGLRPSPPRSTVSCGYSRDSIRPSSWTGCTWVFWGQGHLAPGTAPSVDKMRSTQAFVDWILFSWSFLTSPSLTGTCFINDCLKVLRFTFYLQIMQNHRRTARMACRVFSFSFLFFFGFFLELILPNCTTVPCC